jgi:hypothetical protein
VRAPQTPSSPTVTLGMIVLCSVGWSTFTVPNIGHLQAILSSERGLWELLNGSLGLSVTVGLGTFRHSFYECLHRRADALFELTDALLTADAVPSPVHLSLQAPHRRGWGSLYAALWRGLIDAESLRRLFARHPLAESDTPIYAVDVSVWDRCDAECSPERGFYYHPSRHSAGQPIVAG